MEENLAPPAQATPPIAPPLDPNAAPPMAPPQPESKPKNWPVIILSIFLLIALGAAGFFSYNHYQSKELSPSNSSIINTPNDSLQKNEVLTTSLQILFPDTGQTGCFDNHRSINCPNQAQAFFGQDAQYQNKTPSYTNNQNGTITDNITGLMWQQDSGPKTTYQEAINNTKTFSLAGYFDWRVPTIRELYTLINFNGTDPSAIQDNNTSSLTPFIDTNYFKFAYGNPNEGDRILDSQWVTSNIYQSTVMGSSQCFFGVNFADGRIKCYPTSETRNKKYFTIYVRGDSTSTTNDFIDNKNKTITDRPFGLAWQKSDSGKGLIWQEALLYCQQLDLGGNNDWRLPNAKELQNIVDYSRSPDTTHSPAINPIFTTSTITNEAGQLDYPYFWTSTTHLNTVNASQAVYISFGRAMGNMNNRWLDVHGAGAQRSDPKTGDPNDYPTGHGPQGDAIRIKNYARCVRGGATPVNSSDTDSADNSRFNNNQLPQQTNTPQSGNPPPEAITACNNLSINQSCNFTSPKGQVNGTCRTISNQLACVPTN